jgi:hypothetical protein
MDRISHGGILSTRSPTAPGLNPALLSFEECGAAIFTSY